MMLEALRNAVSGAYTLKDVNDDSKSSVVVKDGKIELDVKFDGNIFVPSREKIEHDLLEYSMSNAGKPGVNFARTIISFKGDNKLFENSDLQYWLNKYSFELERKLEKSPNSSTEDKEKRTQLKSRVEKYHGLANLSNYMTSVLLYESELDEYLKENQNKSEFNPNVIALVPHSSASSKESLYKTPLLVHYTRTDDLEALKKMELSGANFKLDYNNKSLMHYASSERIVDFLQQKGLSLTEHRDGKTPLHSMAEYGNVAAAKYLLTSKKVDVNQMDYSDTQNALDFALSENGITKMFVDSGIKVSQRLSDKLNKYFKKNDAHFLQSYEYKFMSPETRENLFYIALHAEGVDLETRKIAISQNGRDKEIYDVLKTGVGKSDVDKRKIIDSVVEQFPNGKSLKSPLRDIMNQIPESGIAKSFKYKFTSKKADMLTHITDVISVDDLYKPKANLKLASEEEHKSNSPRSSGKHSDKVSQSHTGKAAQR